QMNLGNEMLQGSWRRKVCNNILKQQNQNQNHAELAYILEMPKELGETQIEISIEKEASYIVSEEVHK
ncbi:MAG TPA: hypothetical protein VE223_05805, partial [Nitrososphaeraceae archaeon]|nr:hypothetical protein [Nitrososphaeraceae archaeon]